MTITFNHISLQHVFNIIPPYWLSLVHLHANIVLLGTSLVCTKFKGERMECNIGQDAFFFNSFGIALLFRYIYKGRLVRISENIAFIFYKEIYMNYLILYYNAYYCIDFRCVAKFPNKNLNIPPRNPIWRENITLNDELILIDNQSPHVPS